MNFWERLLELDRRWVFLGIALAVVIPIVTEYALPLGEVAPPTEDVYDAVDAIESGDVLMIAFDYGPSSMPELHPQGLALLQHAFRKDLRVLAVTLNVQGTALARDALATVAEEAGAEDGVDYVNLGFAPGGSAVILGMGENIADVYPTSADGRPVGTLPVMEGVTNYEDIALVVDLAASAAPRSWIAFAHERYGQTLAAGITAVMATDFYPYLQSKQLVGLINGLKGAAEYEYLLDIDAGPGLLGMSAQAISHLFIIFLVIAGNIAYFASGRHRRRR